MSTIAEDGNVRSKRAYGVFLVLMGCLATSPDCLFIRLAELEQGGVCGTFYKYAFKTVITTIGLTIYLGGPRAFIEDCSKNGWYFLIAAACEGGQTLVWNLAVLTTATANAATFLLVNPAWCILWTFLLTGQRAPRYTVVAAAIALSCAGATFAMSRTSTRGVESFLGDLIGVLSGMLYGLYLSVMAVANKKNPDANSLGVLALGGLFATIGAFFIAGGDVMQDCYPKSGPAGYTWAFTNAGFATLAVMLCTLSTKHCPAAVSGLILIVEAISEPYLVWLFLGETPLQSTVVIGAVLCTTLVVHEIVAYLDTSAKELRDD